MESSKPEAEPPFVSNVGRTTAVWQVISQDLSNAAETIKLHPLVPHASKSQGAEA